MTIWPAAFQIVKNTKCRQSVIVTIILTETRRPLGVNSGYLGLRMLKYADRGSHKKITNPRGYHYIRWPTTMALYLPQNSSSYYLTFMFTIQHSSLLFNIHVYYSTFMFTIQHSSSLFNIQVYYSKFMLTILIFKFTIQHSSLLLNIQVYNLATFEFLHSSFLFDMQVLIWTSRMNAQGHAQSKWRLSIS